VIHCSHPTVQRRVPAVLERCGDVERRSVRAAEWPDERLHDAVHRAKAEALLDRLTAEHRQRRRAMPTSGLSEEEMKSFFELPQVKATPGQVVRAFRTNFGLTLKELEKITGVSYPNLSAIEHDRVDVGVRRAVLLAAAFGIEPQQILFPHGYQRPEHQEAQRVRTRAKRMLEKKRHIAA
jgi:transcriptional regulator with XRE-family HTH domain